MKQLGLEVSKEINYYSNKFWRGGNLAQLAPNSKNRQIKSAPNLIFFLVAPN